MNSILVIIDWKSILMTLARASVVACAIKFALKLCIHLNFSFIFNIVLLAGQKPRFIRVLSLF